MLQLLEIARDSLARETRETLARETFALFNKRKSTEWHSLIFYYKNLAFF